MELVLDANILFSALIKSGGNAKILFNENLILYVPEFFFKEWSKYEKLLINKTHRSRKEYDELVQSLRNVITTVPKDEFTGYLAEARLITPDPNDFMYFALALKLNCAIWSNDKKLKNQKNVNVYSTADLIRLLEK